VPTKEQLDELRRRWALLIKEIAMLSQRREGLT